MTMNANGQSHIRRPLVHNQSFFVVQLPLSDIVERLLILYFSQGQTGLHDSMLE
jgi:hypothetical protein